MELIWDGKGNCNYETHKKLELVENSNSDNMYIEGDNLDALILLQKDYTNKIKMIYIDPPYNTGKRFIYNDNYRKRNDKHSDWLNMMYPRLKIARNLLRDDGVIFISIDDNEQAQLKLLCDEIFGEDNFVEIFSWKKTSTPANLSKKSKKSLEYILCYEKIISLNKFNGIKKESLSDNGLLNQSNKYSKLIFPANCVKTKLINQRIKAGAYGTQSYQIELHNDIECKNNKFITPIEISAKFKWGQKN